MKSLSSGGRPQAHTVAAGPVPVPVKFSFTVSQPKVRLVRSRLRFLRWPMQRLKLAWRHIGRAVAVEIVRHVLKEYWSEFFRGRAARAGV